jgi:hypothetical protein
MLPFRLLLVTLALLAASCSDRDSPEADPSDATETSSDPDEGSADDPDAGDAVSSDAGDDALTPDASDAAPDVPSAARVVLNEVNCQGDDFIELFNAGDEAQALGGWVLNDEGAVESGWSIPEGVTLAPGEWAVWYRDEDGGVEGFPFGIKCGEGEDVIHLFDAAGREVDAWALPDLSASGAIHGRLPDGGAWGDAAATPGEANLPWVAPEIAWFDPGVIRQIVLAIPEASVENLSLAPRTWTPATLSMPGEGIGPLEIGVRLKGQLGSFRGLDGKAAFRIDLNRYVAGQTLFGLDELTLNNMVQDPSIIHEFTAYWIFREMGVPSPRVTWVQLSVNGADFGLYLSVEGLNEPMLANWFAGTTHLYEGAYGQDLFVGDVEGLEVDEGDERDRADLARLAALFEVEGVEGFYEASADRVNWDSVVRMMATEVWIGHWDGYAPTRNNYYFHFDQDGVFSILPWGTDQTFSDFLPILRGDGLLFQACLASPVCFADYAGALREVGELVEGRDLTALVAAQARFLRAALIADTRREYDLDTHDAVVSQTLDFLTSRSAGINDEVNCLLGGAPDPDGDGVLCGADCAPDDGAIYPGALDACGDGIDQDCNGYIDDDLSCPDCVTEVLATGSYLFCPNARTFDQALEHCANNGAQPLRIDSADENRAVWERADAIRAQWWWLGLDDRDEEGVFRWIDGDIADFQFWADGEPNDSGGDEDCAHFYDGERWNDIYCDATMGVICELAE